jgi:hypothetical protein
VLKNLTPLRYRATGPVTDRTLLTTDDSGRFDQLTGVRAEVRKLP